MDLSFTDAENAFRIEVRTFIRDNLPTPIHRKMEIGRASCRERV